MLWRPLVRVMEKTKRWLAGGQAVCLSKRAPFSFFEFSVAVAKLKEWFCFERTRGALPSVKRSSMHPLDLRRVSLYHLDVSALQSQGR